MLRTTLQQQGALVRRAAIHHRTGTGGGGSLCHTAAVASTRAYATSSSGGGIQPTPTLHKRALQPDQLSATNAAAAAAPTGATPGAEAKPPHPMSSAAKPPPAAASGGGGIVPVVLLAAAAGGAYYYYTNYYETAEGASSGMDGSSSNGLDTHSMGSGGAAEGEVGAGSAETNGSSSSSSGSSNNSSFASGAGSGSGGSSSVGSGSSIGDSATARGNGDSGTGESATRSGSVAAGASSSSSSGRVVSIAVPEKMKQRGMAAAGSAAATVDHPTGGNRVTGLGSGTAASSPGDDYSATTRALAKLQDATGHTSGGSAAGSKSRGNAGGGGGGGAAGGASPSASTSALLSDLDDLSPGQLKARVVDLATQVSQNSELDALRMQSMLKLQEQETARKYLEVIQTQRLEFEALLATRLREQDHALQTEKSRAVDAVEGNVSSVLNQALEAQAAEHEQDKLAFEEIKTAQIQSDVQASFDAKLFSAKQQNADELEQHLSNLTKLQQKVQQLEKALASGTVQQQGSLRAHRLSAAALALADSLETSGAPAPGPLAALQAAAGRKGVIATACAALPSNVTGEGVPTVAHLQDRFLHMVHPAARQAALVPEGHVGLGGQAVGWIRAQLSSAPSAEDGGSSSSSSAATVNASDDTEITLARAARAVREGDLPAAVAQLEGNPLPPGTAVCVQDWIKDALDRVAVQRSLKVIRMECALLNESCLQEQDAA